MALPTARLSRSGRLKVGMMTATSMKPIIQIDFFVAVLAVTC